MLGHLIRPQEYTISYLKAVLFIFGSIVYHSPTHFTSKRLNWVPPSAPCKQIDAFLITVTCHVHHIHLINNCDTDNNYDSLMA
jgi:hypothetical protein